MFKMAEQRTNTVEKPIKPNKKSDVCLVNTLKLNVLDTRYPIYQIAIIDIVIIITQLVRFAILTLVLDFIVFCL